MEQQGLAISSDNGKSFQKYRGNPILRNPGRKKKKKQKIRLSHFCSLKVTAFRDPKVFYDSASSQYIMCVTGGDVKTI